MPFFAGAVQTTLLRWCCTLAIWKIDFERRLRRRAGQEIRLTPTEFHLLAPLMKNQAALLLAKLLRIIWGPDDGDELQL